MVIFWVTLLVLWSQSEGEDDPGCDRVKTSEHGSLLVRRERGRVASSDICLGELRLMDPVTNKVFCLDKETDEENEFLQCEEIPSTTSTITTSLITTPTTAIISSKTTPTKATTITTLSTSTTPALLWTTATTTITSTTTSSTSTTTSPTSSKTSSTSLSQLLKTKT